MATERYAGKFCWDIWDARNKTGQIYYRKSVNFISNSLVWRPFESWILLRKIINKIVMFIDEMAIPPGADSSIASDHPLSDGPESTWSTFFKDNEFLLQIDKDVRRLCPDISFFQQVGSVQ